ncbi:MAG: hypothetical protein EOP83_11580 [Verrucomicrobiaceae bacterium]|nr:MAG: hypothetical protein EOP83_11580 [Verrucomicrobiaceae bacterium]
MTHEFNVESAWFPVHETPTREKMWFRRRYPVLSEWLDENTPQWGFEPLLDIYEYDSIYSYYRVVVRFSDDDEAFLYRMRW